MLFERSEFIECFGKSYSRPLSQDVFAPFFCFRFLSVMKENEEIKNFNINSNPMSPKLRRFLKALSYILALLAGGSMASCNFLNLTPIIY